MTNHSVQRQGTEPFTTYTPSFAHQSHVSSSLVGSRPAGRQLVGTGAYAALHADRVARAVRPDPIAMLITFTLVVFGLVMVQSASQFADPFDPGAIARRDLLWAALGGLALAITTHVDYHRWRPFSRIAALIAVILLGLVLKIGITVGGAQRWLALGHSFTLQPSEIAKLAFILVGADLLGRQNQHGMSPWSSLRELPEGPVPVTRMHHHALNRVSGLRSSGPLVLFLTIAGMMIGLVLWQNDLGTALVLSAIALGLLIAAGVPWRSLILGGGVALCIGALSIALSPFRRDRVLAFLHVRMDASQSRLMCAADGAAHHVCQSLLALGSGGLFGRGLGHGIEKAGYLPAPFTDSIFAVIGEELGFIGTLFVILLFAALLWRGMRAVRQAPDDFGALLAMGVTLCIGTQAILNIGSSVAALPFTGVPLPYISYGGSSLVVLLAAQGLLLNCSAQGNGHVMRFQSPDDSAHSPITSNNGCVKPVR